MFCCLVLSLLALQGVRRSWWWVAVLAAAVTAAVLVKGFFVVPVLAGMGAWILLNPSRGPGGSMRPVVACALALGRGRGRGGGLRRRHACAPPASLLVAYWRRQMGPVAAAASAPDLGAMAAARCSTCA